MRKAFIIGMGYTGQALACRLQAEGVEVAGTSLVAAAIPGIEVLPVDLTGAERFELPRAEGAVVYYLVPPLARIFDEDRHSHRAPLSVALSALRRVAIRGLVYVSSTAVYGDRQGAWIDETTPPRPDSPWGRMRVELEMMVQAYAQERGRPSCIVRLPEIYGPGRGPVHRLQRGYVLRHPERWSNRIHLEDLIDALTTLGHRLEPELLLVADALPARAVEVYGFAAQLLGMSAVPLGPPSSTGDPNRQALQRDSRRCDSSRLRAWLGRELRYPTYRDGLPATLDGLPATLDGLPATLDGLPATLGR